MNVTYPNKNKALISAITPLIYNTVGATVVLCADIKKDAPTECDSTFYLHFSLALQGECI